MPLNAELAVASLLSRVREVRVAVELAAEGSMMRALP